MNPLLIQIDIGGMWRLWLFVGAVLSVFALMRTFLQHIGILVAALWSYALVSALVVIEFPYPRWGDMQTAFSATAGQSFAEMLLVPLAVALLPGKDVPRVWKGMTLFIMIEIALIWCKGCGVMLAPSFDTALIACFLPFAPWWLLLPAVGTILATHGSTALLIMAAQLVALAIKDRAILWVFLLAIPIFLGVAISHNSDPLLNGGERLQVWMRYMDSWWIDGWTTRALGSGPGSFMWLSMMIDKFKEPHFLQMHNDWLQITFELGLFGLGLTVAVVLKAIKQSWENPRLLAAIFGCAAFGLTYHPLRFMPSMILVALVFREALTGKRN